MTAISFPIKIALPLAFFITFCDVNTTRHENPPDSSPITSPLPAEEWESGTIRNIEWTGSRFDSVWIEYSSNGSDWRRINDRALQMSDSGWQKFPWIIPQDSSVHCQIRIYQDSAGPVFISEPFTIVALKILSPVSGETWERGTVRHIQWKSEYYEDVVIECSWDGGKTWEMIVGEAIRRSDPRWTNVPWLVDGALSGSCRIRLHEYMEPAYFYVSETFSITDPASSDNRF